MAALLALLLLGLVDALKAGESIELGTAAGRPSLNINNEDSSSSSNSSDSSLEQLIEMRLNESASSSVQGRQSEELLSRKRRYLVFPEGSSFQMGKSFLSQLRGVFSGGLVSIEQRKLV